MNLELSVSHTPPRGGKVHDGLGAAGFAGRNDAGAGGDGGFLSVLAALDSPATVGLLDPTLGSPGLQGGLDSGMPPTALEPQVLDSTPSLPDGAWQVDTAGLLAHLSQASQWSPPVGPTAPSYTGVGSPVGVVSKAGAGPVAQASTEPALVEPSATVLSSAPALPALLAGQIMTSVPAAAQLVPANARPAASRRSDGDVAPPLSGTPPAAGHVELNADGQLALAQPRSTRAQPGVTPPGSREKSQTDAGLDVASEALSVPLALAVGDAKAALRDAVQVLAQHAEAEAAKPAVSSTGVAQIASATKIRQAALAADPAALQGLAGPSATTLMGGVTEGIGRKADRVVAKPTESHGGAGGEGQWGPNALLSGRPVEASFAAQSGANPTPEMMVAEQVSYWISGKVQNAELRLDVLGRQPVDVSISMKGGEAQIEFRTDQPQARQVLEGAVAHLEDLLKQEGLSLGGVFVGSSGQQRHGAQPSPERPVDSEVRQVRVDVAQAGASLKTSVGRPVAGRSVDLFV